VKFRHHIFLLALFVLTTLILFNCEKREFTLKPAVVTGEVYEVATLSSKVNGEFIDFGESIIDITAYGHCWSEFPDPDLSNNKTEFNSLDKEDSTFTSTLRSLKPSTKYYVNSYVASGDQLFYGNVKSFTTLSLSELFGTIEVKNIGIFNANIAVFLPDDGENLIIDKGICWGKEPQPSIDKDKHPLGSSGFHTVDLENLERDTVYYVRIYVSTEDEVLYSSGIQFRTLDGVPQLITAPINSVTAKSAISGGNISSDGGDAVIYRGICWNTSGEPDVLDYVAINGEGLGSYSSMMTNLIADQVYNVRAFAINSLDTAYGNEFQFKTLDGVPQIITASINDVTANSATSGGVISNDGGDEVVIRGVCWNSTGMPTILDSKTFDGEGTGTFSSTITGLVENNYYHVRAYAINSIDTAYGKEYRFIANDNFKIPTEGIQAQYMFSGNAMDESGNNFHGTLHGPTLVKDRYNNEASAYYFDGIDDYIDLGESSVFKLSEMNEYTISIWFKAETLTPNLNQTIISRYIAASDNRFYRLFLSADDLGFLDFKTYSQGTAISNTVTAGYNLGWQHVVVVKTEQNISIYLDGVLVQTTPLNTLMKTGSSSAKVLIGSLHQSNQIFEQFFKGTIDDIYVFDRALNESEILYLGL
jgi:hypothetical protein